MDVYPILLTCGIIFLIVAFMHLLRLFYKTDVVIGGKSIPLWVSFIGFILPLSVAIWIFTTIF